MACAMTDLTRVVPLTRTNARANKAEKRRADTGERGAGERRRCGGDARRTWRGCRRRFGGRTWCWGRI